MINAIYSSVDLLKTYSRLDNLLITQRIIKNHSTNTSDIRKIALNRLDLSASTAVLELGCGYGYFIESLKNRLNPLAIITGIDIVKTNKYPYLETIASIGYTGVFIEGDVSIVESMPSNSFDVIISCYSMYFFPHILQQVHRLLKDNGYLIIITHCGDSLKELTDSIQECINVIDEKKRVSPDVISINKLFHSFSNENGKELLQEYFKSIFSIDYPNSLIFTMDTMYDCIQYVEYKEELFFKEIPKDIQLRKRILNCVAFKIMQEIEENSTMKITKDDAIFICRKS